MQRHERIDGGGATFALTSNGRGAPRLLHFGARLQDDIDLAELVIASAKPKRESTPDAPVRPSVFPAPGFGWFGEPAVSGVHAAGDGVIDWARCDLQNRGSSLHATLVDDRIGLRAELDWSLDEITGVLTSHTTLHNDASTGLPAGLARIPLPAIAGLVDRSARFRGRLVSRGTAGAVCGASRTLVARQSHRPNRFRWINLCPAIRRNRRSVRQHHRISSRVERQSPVLVETLPGGQRLAGLGVALAPGEVVIAPGEKFSAATAYACFSEAGFNGVSDAFHPFVRQNVLPPRTATNSQRSTSTPGKHRTSHLMKLRSWNLPRRRLVSVLNVSYSMTGGSPAGADDHSGLGDWRVDGARFPDGLGPLINHVHRLEMDFGLWIEPEMVNPDSDLYRRHPDWCVHAADAERPTMRNQLWLDISREEVRDHLFAALDALLSEQPIAYLKWDCNRFLFPATSGGKPAAHSYSAWNVRPDGPSTQLPPACRNRNLRERRRPH